jgi:hypothetical protein
MTNVWLRIKSTYENITVTLLWWSTTPYLQMFMIAYVTTLWWIQILIMLTITTCDYHKFKWKYWWKMNICHPLYATSIDGWQQICFYNCIYNYPFAFVALTQNHIIFKNVEIFKINQWFNKCALSKLPRYHNIHKWFDDTWHLNWYCNSKCTSCSTIS